MDHWEARLADKEFQSGGPWKLPQTPWEAVGDIVAKRGQGTETGGTGRPRTSFGQVPTYPGVCAGRLCSPKQGGLPPSRLSPASESPGCLDHRGNGLNSPCLVVMKDVP